MHDSATEHLTDVDQLPSKEEFNAALVMIAKRRFTEANRCFSDGVCECDSCVAGQTLVEEIERLQDRAAELERIARAARAVVAYDWSDNDEDAVAAIDQLCKAVGPWLERRRSETTGEGEK